MYKRQVLVSADSVEVREMPLNKVELAAWDEYQEIVLILVQTDLEGRSYEYQVAAEYDPELGDYKRPLAFKLRQSYPNPFRPQVHDHVVMPFDLSVASENTRLSIFAADGSLVRRFEMGVKIARHYDDLLWDGLNGCPLYKSPSPRD